MVNGSSRFTHVSLGSLEDRINLNPRQLELLKQRRARLDGQVDKKVLPAKPSLLKNQHFPDVQKGLDLEQVGTAPTASFGSSASEASSGTSSKGLFSNPKPSFYGQAMSTKERKKFYDDTGASCYESSSSEASAPSAVSSQNKLKPSSTDLTDALTKASSYGSGAPSEQPSMKESVHDSTIQMDMKALLKKRLLANMSEKRKQTSNPLPPKENRRQSAALKGPRIKGGLPDDQQRAFLRTLMQSAYKPKEEEAVPKEVIHAENRSLASARSGVTSSSATSAEDKAIMRKVLERNRKKRASSEQPKNNFFKSASNNEAKPLSPTSGTSDETGNDERSSSTGSRRLFGRSTPRRNKKSRSPRIRKAMSRWASASGSNPEKQDTSTQNDATASERISISNLEISHQKTMLTGELSGHNGKKGDLMIEAPTTVDVNPQLTEVSALSRKSSTYLAEGPSFQSRAIHHGLPFDDEATRGGDSVPSRSSIGRDGTEVAEAKHARAVTESLMEPVDDLTSPTLPTSGAFQSPLISTKSAPSKNLAQAEGFGIVEEEDPEGYAHFVATLKAEVAGSHSLLWESFRGLFREDRNIRPLASGSESCHFDRKTKAIVTEMSTYLKKNHHVTCVPGAEIANDKTVRAKPVLEKPNFGRHVIETKYEYDPDTEGGTIKQVPSTDSINEDSENNVIEVTLGQFVRKSMGGAAIAPVARKAPLKTATSTKSTKIAPKPGCLTPKSNTDSSLPWSGVKLRSINEVDKSEVSGSSIPTSWAKVRLRPVTGKSDNTKTFDGISNSGVSTDFVDDSSDFRRIIVSKKKEGVQKEPKTPTIRNEPEVIEIIDLEDVSSTAGHPIDLTTNGNPIDLTDKSNEDSPIDLTTAQTPRTVASRADTRVTGITADGSVLVPLAPEPNSEPVKVLIGKRGLVKIRTKPGETKARVIWRHELEDIRSAMLDLAASKVKLLLHSSDDHKDLAFASTDACMRFANALHEQTSLKTGDNDDDTEAITVEESLYVEQLNEEEQRVLEEFRQSKKHDPPATLNQIATAFEKPMSVINADSGGPHSPMSEISGPGAALSSVDIVNITAVGNRLTSEEEAIAAGFRKMLKMRVPPEAVRHKMEKEGIEKNIMAVVLGQEPPTPDPVEPVQSKAITSLLSHEEEAIAAPYRKMLKMMIPKEAVEHKMFKDKVPQKIMSEVVGTRSTADKAASSVPGIPELSDEEEAMASAYRKMLSLRIPKEAVRQKMEGESISKKIIASVLKENFTEETKKGPAKRGKQGFHWKPLESNENLQNSVWSKASFDSSLLDDDVTISSHVEQFQKKPQAQEAQAITKSKGDSQKDKAKLIDLGRANNIAITLKAFGDFSHDELAQAIEFLDPFEKIKGDRALFMKDLLPASAEIKVIKGYIGDENRLVSAEKWFTKIIHIKRIEEKIHVLRTMESFRNEAIALGDTFQQLTNVCNQVMGSEKLPDLLEMVRQIGNRMNNESGEEAAGFKLDFLPRLAQTKGSDKKTTALDLVVMIFHTRNRREALLLNEDFPGCHEASRLQIRELIADVKMLGGAMQKCQKELDLLINENGFLPPRRKIFIGDSHSESGLAAPSRDRDGDSVKTDVSSLHEELFAKRANLINSAIDRGILKQATSPRAAFLDAIADRNLKSYNLQGAVNRVKNFMEEANIIFAELETKRDRALSACNDLTDFFCEAGGERNAPMLLSILAEFAGNLHQALSKYDNQQKTEARKKANLDKKSKEIANRSEEMEKRSRKASHAEKKSLVLMVNEMLKIAGDKQRKDFVKGVVYENPDSRLKQIYEAEKMVGKTVGSPGNRKNILRTIEERRNADDSQIALSELAQAMQKRTLSSDSQSPTAQSITSCDSPTATATSENNAGRQLSIIDRWTRKFDDETVTGELKFDPFEEKSESGIMASDSHDSEDRMFEEMKRKQYVGRWASNNDMVETTTNNDDLDCESDIDVLLDYHNRKRQVYVNRWARKPQDNEEEVESLSLSSS